MVDLSKYKKVLSCDEYAANAYLQQGWELIQIIVIDEQKTDYLTKYTQTGSSYSETIVNIIKIPKFILGLTEMGKTLYE